MTDTKIGFIDLETTGLHSNDRVVSLALIVANEAGLIAGRIDGRAVHLIFDPVKKSHPRAEQVHGWDDWTLRHQDRFEEHAAAVVQLLSEADIIVAHNAAFDLDFIGRELEIAGLITKQVAVECTMLGWRDAYPGRPASLGAIAGSLGLMRNSNRHGAMEDAWLAMAVLCSLNSRPLPPTLPHGQLSPSNFREPPRRPEGPLPRRNNKRVIPPAAASALPNPQRQALFTGASPLATLMLEVAQADHLLTVEEADALTLLVRDVGRRLGIADARLQHEVVGDLFDLADKPLDLEAAVRGVLASEWQRDSVGRWMREVTYADGAASDEEASAITRISEIIRKVKQS